MGAEPTVEPLCERPLSITARLPLYGEWVEISRLERALYSSY